MASGIIETKRGLKELKSMTIEKIKNSINSMTFLYVINHASDNVQKKIL